jgi:hypothetical protein
MIIYGYLEERAKSRKSLWNRRSRGPLGTQIDLKMITKRQRAENVSRWVIAIILVNSFTYGICDASSLYFNPDVRVPWNLVFTGLGSLMIII